MKKLKLFFACLLMAVLSIGQVWADDTPTEFSWAGSATDASGTTDYVVTESPITLTFSKGTNANAPRTNKEGAVRMYTGTTLTISSSAGNITRVVFTPTTNSYQATNLTYNSTALTGNDWTLSSPAASVTLTATANARFKSMVVYTANGGGSDPVAVTGVSLNKASTSIVEGKTETLVATVAPDNASDKSVSWSSDDESVATVDGGVVTAVAAGTATITVTTTDGSFTDECEVTVTEAPAAVNYMLVTNVSALAADAEIIIVNIDEDKAISTTQASSNRTATTVSSTSHVIAAGDDVQVITLEASGDNWKFNVGDSKYLYASSNSSNQLKTAAASTAGDNGVWAIAIASDGAATVRAQGSNSRKELHYNPNNGSPIFSCYAENSTTGTLVKIFKKLEGAPKADAGLAYAAADAQKLVKVGGSLVAPTLSNDNNLTVSYASSDENIVKVDASTGEITEIVAAGKAVITASSAETPEFYAGSASYTIGVTNHAGTEVEPYDVTDAKVVIDAVGTKENAYVAGEICTIQTTTLPAEGYITFFISADGTTSGQQLEAYKCKSLNGEAFAALSDVETGATVVITGTLKKYNSTYELDADCHLVSYEAPEAQKQSIANDQTNPYTVAQALVYAADGVTYDLDDYVYVRGVVYDVKSFNNGAMNIFIKDADAENSFELYKCAGINDGNATTPFEALTDVQAGNIVIGYGQLTVYNNVSEFKQGNYLVDLQKPVTAVEMDATAEVEVGSTVTLTAVVMPSNADQSLTWSVVSGGEYASVQDGVVSGVAEGEAVIRAASTDDPTKYSDCTVTITAAAPALTDYYEKATSVVEGTYLIVYEDVSVAFNGGLETLDAKNNVIDVEITNDNKIGVTSATEAATVYIDPTAGTIKAANGKYIGITSYGNGLSSGDNGYVHTNMSIEEGNAVLFIQKEEWNDNKNGKMQLCYNSASDQNRFRYFKEGSQKAIQLYKLANETIKPAAGLAWDPADDIELTVGGDFTAPTLLNPNNIDDAEITIESSNEAVAIINNSGEVELVAEATGTTTITATFDGNDSYKPATVSYKIKVNPASSIYVLPSLNVNFGSVEKDAALPADQTITVTLNNVDAATATLGGTNPEAFNVDKTALTASGDITISVVSSATVGEFKATLTISDDASAAASKEVKLSFTVTDPASEETPISTSTQWVPATEIVDGMQVLITGVKDNVTYAMGEQKSTNRAAYVATLNEGVLTPGEGTMAFTLVAQGDGTYAIRTSNGKYLYAAASESNHLKTQDEVDVNAKWTLTVASAVAEGSSNRNIMRFNGGSTKLFSCYSSGQEAIKFYVPKPVTPPTPVYETVREGLTAGKYYTICYPKAMTDVQGATLWSFVGKDANFAYIEQETATTIEAGKPYIMYATASTVTAVLGDETNAPGENGAIHGTFSNLTQDQLNTYATVAGNDLYLVIGNELRRATGEGTGSNTLPAQRAFVVLGDIPAAPAQMPAHVRAMPMHKDTATGLDALNASDKPVKMVINGQLFILRGEKLYDATGRLVK